MGALHNAVFALILIVVIRVSVSVLEFVYIITGHTDLGGAGECWEGTRDSGKGQWRI